MAGRGKVRGYLLVSFQLLHKRVLVEEPLQAVLGVVVAQLLKGGPAGRPTLLWVLEAWRVHDHHRTQRVLAGLERPSWGEPGSEPARRHTRQALWSALLSRQPRPCPGAQDAGEDGLPCALCWQRTALPQQSHWRRGTNSRKTESSWALPGAHLFTRETRRVKSSL